jgi:hypothetical protein
MFALRCCVQYIDTVDLSKFVVGEDLLLSRCARSHSSAKYCLTNLLHAIHTGRLLPRALPSATFGDTRSSNQQYYPRPDLPGARATSEENRKLGQHHLGAVSYPVFPAQAQTSTLRAISPLSTLFCTFLELLSSISCPAQARLTVLHSSK